MKVVYVFQSPHASYIIGQMILPQMEEGRHPVDVVGMFFFVDNTYLLQRGNPFGERLMKLMKAGKIKFLMDCDQCAYQREIADKLVEGATIGCFPDLYGAVMKFGGADLVITL